MAVHWTEVWMMHRRHEPHLIHLQYRPDIDGLRAVAILSVVLFHAWPGLIPGGYIGVDVFFVISGYLISGIIFSSLEHDRFSLTEFYVRRIRRIFPALVIVLAACLAFGWFVLYADEYGQLGKHAAAAAGFVQNFVLWSETGYFDNAASSKPLLHLWSLGIEEQFYIVWPLLLAFVWKRRWNFLAITALIAVVSFVMNLHLTIIGLQSDAFYLPFARFWELMAGGILAYLALHRPSSIERFKEGQSVAGAVLLLAGLLLLGNKDEFPGWRALLPVLGAYLLISAGPEAHINRKLLASKPMVWIGLISYPLYLWHWPLLVFLGILYPHSSVWMNVATLVASVLLAWMTFALVERKIRAYGRVVKLLLAAMILIAVTGALVFFAKGLPQRDVNKPLHGLDAKSFKASRRSDGSCRELFGMQPIKEEVCLTNSAQPKVLFLGDSHAMALYSAIHDGKYSLQAMLISSQGCTTYPFLKSTLPFKKIYGNYCTETAIRGVEAALAIASVDTVVISNRGPRVETDVIYHDAARSYDVKEAFLVGNEGLIRTLLKAGKKVIFVIDTPKLKRNVHGCLQRGIFGQSVDCASTRSEHDAYHQEYLANVRQIHADFPGLIVFDPTSLFCDHEQCRFQDEQGNLLYFDSHHISSEASRQMLGRMFGG